MASQDEVQRQLAELSARVDALATMVEALRGTRADSQAAAANAVSHPHSPPSMVHGSSPAGSTPQQRTPGTAPKVGLAAPISSGKGTLENRIGSQLLNRIGIFAVLIAVAWFLKLAFDRNWIGPGVRIALGIAIAAGLIAWSERFRARGFSAFSYTLKALGTGIAYLSLWAAWSLYHLLPAEIVFVAMLVITLANAFLAWRQDSELLAVYALAGGLATPALLSLSAGHEVFLFSYLFMLSAGALLLFALRPWKRLAVAAFLGTVTYCAVWDIRSYDPSAFSITLIFVAVFFLVFASAPFFLQGKTRGAALPQSDSLFLIAFPIVNGAVAFVALMSLFGDPSLRSLRPWSVFVLSALFWLLAALGPRAFTGLLSNVHLGLAILFLVVAIPLEFHGCMVALFWLGVALLLVAWAAARLKEAARIFGAAVLALAALEVILLEWVAPVHHPLPLLVNPHFATYVAACGVFAGVARMSLRMTGGPGFGQDAAAGLDVQASSAPSQDFGSWRYLAAFGVILFSLTALLAVSLEIHHYWFCGAPFFHDYCSGGAEPASRAVFASLTYSVWYMLYGAALMAVGFLRRNTFLRWQALLLLGFSIGKVFLVDASHLSQGYRVLSFLALGILLLAVSFAYQRDWLDLRGSRTPRRGDSLS